MRSITGRFTDLARNIGKGTIFAQSDAQATLAPGQFATMELPNIIRDFTSPGSTGVLDDSFKWDQSFTINGVSAGSQQIGPTLARGLWRVSGFMVRTFAGTPNGQNSCIARLQDLPGGGATLNLSVIPNVVGTIIDRWSVVVSLGVDARLFLTTPAQLAGDVLTVDSTWLLSRLF